jgi:OmpA-OmpF porin, OOP family
MSMKYLRALLVFSLIPFMTACSSSGQIIDGWSNCVIGGAAAGAAGGALLDGHAPGAIVGASVGALVGAILCGDADSDGDGVADSDDKCPGTPKGVAVYVNGCPVDSDGDGVPDYKDKCPNTPAGVKVDGNGCPIDSDGDGVPDSADKCPGTPGGVKVDKHGCPYDDDQDGVPNYLDRCPDTAKGMKVDADGCAIKLVTLHGIKFAIDSAKIMPESVHLLQQAVVAMRKHPGIKVEIVGHTDSTASDAYNKSLSDRRANAVRAYLIKHGGIAASRMSASGMGEAKPIASNKTRQGRALNRRVEFLVKG